MKKLSKADIEAKKAADEGTFSIGENGTRTFEIGDMVIRYFGNGGSGPDVTATNFYVRQRDQEDDISSDYWAGSFWKTLTGAIRYARNRKIEKESKKTWVAVSVDSRPQWSGPLNLVSLVLQSDEMCEEAIAALAGKPVGVEWGPDDDARPELSVKVQPRPANAERAEREAS